jgi:hypothetical protein
MSLRNRLDSDRPFIDLHVSDTRENYYGSTPLATFRSWNIASMNLPKGIQISQAAGAFSGVASGHFTLNPDSALEREVMSKERTVRLSSRRSLPQRKENAFLPLRRRRLSVRCVIT